MRIIQTFWSGGRDPLQYGYGWPLPEYNMMSWVLSCLSLRKYYDDVELYTDKLGYELLIEKLRLPYTHVHVVYDENLCRPLHWAYAKIRTYTAQTEPFLHVDGDVYISQPFPDVVFDAPLVAQNREIGTVYYQKMIDDILKMSNIVLSEDLMNSISLDMVSSYNMGVFGGNDMEFIHEYCEKAIGFVVRNHLDDIEVKPKFDLDCNILFEQVFFAVLADKFNRDVVSVIDKAIKDEGYTSSEFCDICNFDSHRYCHILGGHKRNKNVLKDLSSLLYSRYRDYYNRILSISSRHLVTKESIGYYKYVPGKDKDGISRYLDFLNSARSFWNSMNSVCGSSIDENTSKSLFYKKNGLHSRITTHPLLWLYKVSEDWTETEKNLLRKRLYCEDSFPIEQIALIPYFSGRDCMEIPLLREDAEILLEIGNDIMSIKSVVERVLEKYEQEDVATRHGLVGYFTDEIYRLISQSVLIFV